MYVCVCAREHVYVSVCVDVCVCVCVCVRLCISYDTCCCCSHSPLFGCMFVCVCVCVCVCQPCRLLLLDRPEVHGDKLFELLQEAFVVGEEVEVRDENIDGTGGGRWIDGKVSLCRSVSHSFFYSFFLCWVNWLMVEARAWAKAKAGWQREIILILQSRLLVVTKVLTHSLTHSLVYVLTRSFTHSSSRRLPRCAI